MYVCMYVARLSVSGDTVKNAAGRRATSDERRAGSGREKKGGEPVSIILKTSFSFPRPPRALSFFFTRPHSSRARFFDRSPLTESLEQADFDENYLPGDRSKLEIFQKNKNCFF